MDSTQQQSHQDHTWPGQTTQDRNAVPSFDGDRHDIPQETSLPLDRLTDEPHDGLIPTADGTPQNPSPETADTTAQNTTPETADTTAQNTTPETADTTAQEPKPDINDSTPAPAPDEAQTVPDNRLTPMATPPASPAAEATAEAVRPASTVSDTPAPLLSQATPLTSATPRERLPLRQQDELPLQQPQEVITLELPDLPFSKIIQQFRLDANVPIKEVSDKTKISVTFINDLEQAHFNALPSLDFCLAKIEQLCLEYEQDSKQLIDKFCLEYQQHKQKEEPRTTSVRLHGRRTPGGFIQTEPPRLPGLPAIFIGLVLLLLIGLLGYAFHAHQTHQMPDRMDVDLTEHIPVHQPEIMLLDETRR